MKKRDRIIFLFLAFFSMWQVKAEETQLSTIAGIAGLPQAEALRLGERMYREGILPSGEPMQAFVKGDIPVTGTSFTCISCHLRSGLGSIEGGVVTPPTNGKILFQPLKLLYKGYEVPSVPPIRPAYTDESLAEVLQGGIDPSGRVLNEIMPRYHLPEKEMAILIFYLKSLSSEFSPGVLNDTIRFATVISDDVTPQDRDAMIAMLEYYIKLKNNSAIAYKTDPKQNLMAKSMLQSKETVYKRISLSQWVLKGPPETWRSQLEEYSRREPVFALIGGITTGEWKPVHDFCESNHIPCLFPLTDFPVISETGWYTLYLSKGYYQEGEAAARYLNSKDESLKGKAVVLIVSSSHEGAALASGFQQTWSDLGHQPPVTVILKKGEALSKKLLKQVLDKEKPASIILWVGPEALPALETLATASGKPEIVLVSSSYLKESIWTLNEDIRDITYIAYPFILPQEEAKSKVYVPLLREPKLSDSKSQFILKRTFPVILAMSQALIEMKGNYYRDNFLDVISMMMDQKVRLYERLSFGPGQRYASKGCYIVQLTKGPNPELVKRSDWVIH